MPEITGDAMADLTRRLRDGDATGSLARMDDETTPMNADMPGIEHHASLSGAHHDDVIILRVNNRRPIATSVEPGLHP